MMRKKTGLAVLLALVAAAYAWTAAGELEPPGAPAPTMVTLQQIHDTLDDCAVGGRCRVLKTGQTACYDADGTQVACAGTGQDGEYQTGIALDPRFTDNGDGTVTDNLTRLTWLQDANCFGPSTWTLALADANALADGACGLTDGSQPGDWRLPNVREMLSVLEFTQWKVEPPAGHPFSGLQTAGYWSSSSGMRFPDHGWALILGGGQLNLRFKTESFHVWAVRGGL